MAATLSISFKSIDYFVQLLHRSGDAFDKKAALQELIEQYGVDQQEAKKTDRESSSPDKKRKRVKKEDEGGSLSPLPDSNKKPKKTEIVQVEENRAAAEAIHEMGVIYFKNKDMRKGGTIAFIYFSQICNGIDSTGVFSKAAKAIRECEFPIKNAKDAMKLKGVGKGIGGYVEELLETGVIEKLEELRAGVA